MGRKLLVGRLARQLRELLGQLLGQVQKLLRQLVWELGLELDLGRVGVGCHSPGKLRGTPGGDRWEALVHRRRLRVISLGVSDY